MCEGVSALSGTGQGAGQVGVGQDSHPERLLVDMHLSKMEVKETFGQEHSEFGSGLCQVLLS